MTLPPTPGTALSNEQVAQQVHHTLAPLGAVSLDADLPKEITIGRVRRRGAIDTDDVRMLSLVDVDGVLLWEDGPIRPSISGVRRAGPGQRLAGASLTTGDVVAQVKYVKPLGVNDILDKLQQLDGSLTPEAAAPKPQPGQPPPPRAASTRPGAQLLSYDVNTWAATPIDAVPAGGPILLLIHGTFSNTGNLVNELKGHPTFAAICGRYAHVLGFDHFTVSRTPVVNAAELARLFDGCKVSVDIVCHSRGGLVARWFVEMLDPFRTRKVRIVFVGCPLQGTSLADPASLRHGINLMTNIGKALGAGATLVPFVQAASGLIQIVSAIGSVAGRSPLVDAGIGLLPGIGAMSRIGNNAELNALNYGASANRDNYFAVSSSFTPSGSGWQFCKLFNKIAGAAAEYLVFEQENDLVVDTSSMTHFVFGPSPNVKNQSQFCMFDGNDHVHHTSYFREARTIDFIDHALDKPTTYMKAVTYKQKNPAPPAP
jgi:hypothetical protein